MNKDPWLEEIKEKVQQERVNYKGPHCCLTMHSELEYGLTVLDYNAKYREYGIKIPNSGDCVVINYCLACGKKMLPSLRSTWFTILWQNYKIEDPINRDRKHIPQEFLTDEWWKKDMEPSVSICSPSQKHQEIEKKIGEKRMDQHCCPAIQWELINDTSVLEYNAKYREYAVKIPNSSTYALMDYCIFCGEKMPSSLRDEWFDILEQEYQLEDPMDDDRKKIPQEFLTDEWWKKRHL